MAKRACVESCGGIDKLSEGCVESGDRINKLPDKLLVKIVSLLPLKEAVASSIVCRRWRYLWTFLDKLDIQYLDMPPRRFNLGRRSCTYQDFITVYKALGHSEYYRSWNYVARVNHVLGLHKGCSIDEFKLDFYVHEAHETHVDRWLRFASSRKVESLELKLKTTSINDRYCFPLMSFQHLRRMRVEWVSLSGQCVEFLLQTCPLLEQLSVSLSMNLISLNINVGPSLKLRVLEIRYCSNFTKLEIRDAVNLECSMYEGKRLDFFFVRNVPHLLEMHLGGRVVRTRDHLLSFLTLLPLLEKLTIDMASQYLLTTDMQLFGEKEAMMFYNDVTMWKLKELVVKFHGEGIHHRDLMPLTYFIRASPLLQSFVFEVFDGKGKKLESSSFVNELPEKEKVEVCYPHLKRIELVGYRGTSPELELVVHLLENGSALEEVTIDLRKRDNTWVFLNFWLPNSATSLLPVGYPCTQKDQIDALKARVRDQLAKRLPSTRPTRLNVL